MKKFARPILILFISLTLFSCATTSKKERSELRTLFKTQQFDKALLKLGEIAEFKDPNNQLILALEKGTILHQKGDYYQSSEEFRKAKEIIHKNYTVRISQKAKTLFTNDNFDVYYGVNYEHSLLHFYQMMNFYMLYKTGKKIMPDGKVSDLNPQDKLNYLRMARAEVIDWDVTQDKMKQANVGRGVFKRDLAAKLIGGAIHESFRKFNEDQIALQLYKDAKDILLKNYNAYKTLNKSYKKFISDYDKFPSMPIESVEKNYVEPTSAQNALKDFLDFKIISLTNIIRKNDFNNQVRIQKPSQEILNLVKQQKERSNVSIVLQRKLIPKKVGEKVYADLQSALEQSTGSKAVASIGAAAISIFAAHKLGLTPPANNWSVAGAELGYRFTHAALTGAAIGFELPKISKPPKFNEFEVAAFDDKNKMVKVFQSTLMDPIGDMAEEAVAAESIARYTRLAIRLATKHATAIAAAYATYKGLEKKSEFFAKAAAMATYLASAKAIEVSEKADTRYWSTLPGEISFSESYLPPGSYFIKIRIISDKNNQWDNLGQISVDKNDHLLHSFRLF
ncbi:MAG: hypothetical protein H6622_14690 [Halobacteriovoraceae bacterium]|nr:hypothetical protein [Halobacteriovoraceae bacterium]